MEHRKQAGQKPKIIPTRPDLDELKARAPYNEILGERYISIPEPQRDELVEYILFLENLVPAKRRTPRALTTVQKRVIESEVATWAASTGPKDRRTKDRWGYQPAKTVLGNFPSVDERVLRRWRSEPQYRAAFIQGCAARLGPHTPSAK